MNDLRRRRLARTLWPVAALIVGAACGDGLVGVCLTYAAPSVQVMPRDAATDAYLGAGATLVQHSGTYIDSISLPLDYAPPYEQELVVSSAFERPGIYELTVRRAGYADWVRTNVHVSANSCHVETVRLEARLEALP